MSNHEQHVERINMHVDEIRADIDLVGIAKTQAVQGEKISNIEHACNEIKNCLLGNGKVGLVTRTDRLEQTERFRGKLFWIVATAVAGLLVKATWMFFID